MLGRRLTLITRVRADSPLAVELHQLQEILYVYWVIILCYMFLWFQVTTASVPFFSLFKKNHLYLSGQCPTGDVSQD